MLKPLIYYGEILQAGTFPLEGFQAFANTMQNHDVIALHMSHPIGTVSAVDSFGAVACIDLAQKPVYLHLGLSPSAENTTATVAITRAKSLALTINVEFIRKNMLNLLAGFSISNALTEVKYPDGSIITRAHINELCEYIHKELYLPVLLTSSDSIDQLSLYNPDSRRTVSPGAYVGLPELGSDPARPDILVHMNPLLPWHIWDPSTPELILDFSRFQGVLAIIKSHSTSNLDHIISQCYPFSPHPDDRLPARDTAFGFVFDTEMQESLRRMSQFLASCNVNYTLSADTAWGALFNIFYDFNSYAEASLYPEGDIPKVYSQAGVIYLEYDDGKVLKFTDDLKEIAE